MPIKLCHLGEDLVAEMFRVLATRGELQKVRCAVTGRSLAEDVADLQIGESPTIRAEDASLVVNNAGVAYACDGEQRLDVICAGNGRALAIEVKLGETLMGPATFRKRFCARCETSRHTDSRLSGSMIAVLERSFPFDTESGLTATLDNLQWSLVLLWWLVLRQSVLQKWQRANDTPTRSARVLSFDALAKLLGSSDDFDRMVLRVVGSGFSSRWRVQQ